MHAFRHRFNRHHAFKHLLYFLSPGSHIKEIKKGEGVRRRKWEGREEGRERGEEAGRNVLKDRERETERYPNKEKKERNREKIL